MSYQMLQRYNIQIATKKPMGLVHVQYLGKVRRPPPLSPTSTRLDRRNAEIRTDAGLNKRRK